MNAICPVEHAQDPDRPRRTPDGHTICGGCARGHTQRLHALPGLHESLMRQHQAQRGPQTRITGSGTRRLPISPTITQARHDIVVTTCEWAIYAAQQATHAGVSDTPWPLLTDLEHAADWLALHADWCARRDWAPDLVTAIRRLHGHARNLLDPKPRQSFPIPGTDGHCVRAPDDQPCPGRMWVTIPSDDATSAITCDTCGHVYPPVSWLRLGRLVHARKGAT